MRKARGAMGAIFISYRREDSEAYAGRLFDILSHRFGKDRVFMDVAGIEVGRDFRRVIEQRVASCGVLLAVIGKNWVTAADADGHRRLDDQGDYVRLEIAQALKRDVRVVPVLVNGAMVPRAELLPDDLKELSYRGGVELTHARWDSDVAVLINAVEPCLASEETHAPREPSKSPWSRAAAAFVLVIALGVGAYLALRGEAVAPVEKAAATSETKQAEAKPVGKSEERAVSAGAGRQIPALSKEPSQAESILAVPKGKFAVEVQSTTELSVADALVEKLTKAGYSPYVLSDPTPMGIRYHVRIGNFALRDEAILAQERLRTLGIGYDVILTGR